MKVSGTWWWTLRKAGEILPDQETETISFHPSRVNRMKRLLVRLSLLFLLLISCITTRCSPSRTGSRKLNTRIPAIERNLQPSATPRIPAPVIVPADKGTGSSPTVVPAPHSMQQVTGPVDRAATPAFSHMVQATLTEPSTHPVSAFATLQEITVMLTSQSDAGVITGNGCNTTSCTGQSVNRKVQTLAVRVTGGPGSSTAQQDYAAEKSSHQGPATVDLTYGNASFTSAGGSSPGTILHQGQYLVTKTLAFPPGTLIPACRSGIMHIVSMGYRSG